MNDRITKSHVMKYRILKKQPHHNEEWHKEMSSNIMVAIDYAENNKSRGDTMIDIAREAQRFFILKKEVL